jgi:DNA gyrase subunit A
VAEIIIEKSLGDAFAPRYKMYAQETLAERAIPDIRDGLKPVHLRILYCMYNDLKLMANHKTIKSAKVSGAVMGAYHPHGDSYPTMVGMAQPWNMRYPIIEIQGNLGNIDGDPPAASRYTECRLTKYGEMMMSDIDKNVVDTRATYDDTSVEPVVASGLIANCLLNPSTGIACGFSTTMASHNLVEVYDALDYILAESIKEDGDVVIDNLLNILKGPDFPTGAIIVDNSDWYKIFTEGKGKVTIRAKYEIVTEKKKTYIKVTEIPYGVNKLKLVNSIDDKVQKGILLDIKEVIDASNEDVVNIQIVLKKGANPDLVISNLLAKTDLQTNFNYNMNTILNKQLNEKPTGILDCLYEFINHGLNIIKRRTQYDIDKLNKRVLILEGLLTILNDLEQALEIIKSNDDPKEGLESVYGLNDEQTEYILNMKLRRINNQDKAKVEEELNELNDRLPKLLSIVNDEKVALETLKEELAIIKEKFGDDRRTSFDLSSNANISIEDLVVDEDLIITITNEGNIKSVSASAYESQRRGGKGNKGAKIKDDEIIVDLFSVNSKDDILFITNTGRCHVLKAYQIPKVARNAKGKNIVNYLKLDEGEYPVSTLTTNIANNKDSALTLLTKQGKIKRINLTQLSTKYSYTRIIGLNDGDVVVKALLTDDNSEVLLVTEQGLYVRFPISTVRPQGRSAEGVRAIKFKLDNDSLLTATVISDTDEIITITEQGIGKRSKADEYSASKNRGGAGFIFYKVNDRVGKVAAVLSISNKEDILITTKNGVVIRIPSDSISLLSRTAMGVKLITLNDNDSVASIAKIIPNKDEEGEEVDSE